ncbi:hypothetical protein [Streptomyces sp. NPDC056628]|uniref:hypothetical protein n=1 Tax=Streptomyces sp. NPDC056628 TaxID=3345882 RepID=UPI00368DE4AF
MASFQLGSWAFHRLAGLLVCWSAGLLVGILIASFLAPGVEPPIGRMVARGMCRGLAAFLVCLAVVLGVAGFFVLFGSFLAGQISGIVPAVAFGSVIVGTALLGVAGTLIAIPVVATLQTFFGAYV